MIPPTPPPVGTVGPGMAPGSAAEVNYQVGALLREFTEIKAKVHKYEENLAPLILTQNPYNMSAEDETLIKSAINGLDASLGTVDMTFINRLTGLW